MIIKCYEIASFTGIVEKSLFGKIFTTHHRQGSSLPSRKKSRIEIGRNIVWCEPSPLKNLFFILIFFMRDIKTLDYSFIMRTFAIATFGVCCILILRLLVHNNFNFDRVLFDMQRLGQSEKEIGGMVINPNSLGVLCVFAISCLMQIRSAGEKKVFDIFLLVAILVLGALTCSRTYLACLFILCSFIFVVSKKGAKEKLKFLLWSIIVITISVTLLYLLFPSTVDMFFQRLNVENIMSGRDTLFNMYNNYLLSSSKALIWGLGSLNLAEEVMELSIAFNVPHNGIQEICVAWGIPGLLFFAAMIFVMIRRSKQENPHQVGLNYLLLVILFAKIMVGQVITSSYTMLSFALIYLSLCQDFSINRQTEQIKSK